MPATVNSYKRFVLSLFSSAALIIISNKTVYIAVRRCRIQLDNFSINRNESPYSDDEISIRSQNLWLISLATILGKYNRSFNVSSVLQALGDNL